jgi:hypothetical protein
VDDDKLGLAEGSLFGDKLGVTEGLLFGDKLGLAEIGDTLGLAEGSFVSHSAQPLSGDPQSIPDSYPS